MTIQLGLSGLEADLLQDSLIVSSMGVQDNSYRQRSSNATLHVDYLPTKKVFTLTYSVISKQDWQTFVDIYDLQVSSLQPLSFKIEESTGVTTYSVDMPPISRGEDMRDKPYYYGMTITLSEK